MQEFWAYSRYWQLIESHFKKYFCRQKKLLCSSDIVYQKLHFELLPTPWQTFILNSRRQTKWIIKNTHQDKLWLPNAIVEGPHKRILILWTWNDPIRVRCPIESRHGQIVLGERGWQRPIAIFPFKYEDLVAWRSQSNLWKEKLLNL